MPEISWDALWPLSSRERRQLGTRLNKLATMEAAVEQAGQKFAEVRAPKQLLIRPRFAIRPMPEDPSDDPSDRHLPPRADRPPSTRLVSPRGIALKLFLTALFLAQTRTAGERPGNKLPLDNRDNVSWVDLFATPAKPGVANGYSTVRDKKLRQIQDALGRLADPTVQLATLPRLQNAIGKYEGFLLMHEGGAPYEGGPNDSYTIPAVQGPKLIRLPAEFFVNGWIHVLEDSEIAFVLMIACLQALYGERPVFAPGNVRLLQFGVGRETYYAHRMLTRFNLIDVEQDPNRDIIDSTVRGFSAENPPKLHRFRLLRDGFQEPAIDVIRSSINRRLGVGS